jgi:putative tryptophan/tyrosine transport system substrate-binding protein
MLDVRRREVLTLLGGAAAAWPLAARAQQPAKIAHVGWLSASLNNPVQALGHEVLVSTLRRLGFTEGENLILEHRPADQGMANAFAGANELVAAKADVLIADGPELALQAATAARPMVPVVMLANNYNPFERGYVKSLAQPGGNVTGVFYRQQELAAKQLELLVEAFPERKRVVVLWDSISEDTFHAAEHAADSMSLSLDTPSSSTIRPMISRPHSNTCRKAGQRRYWFCRAPYLQLIAFRLLNSLSDFNCPQCSSLGRTWRQAA